MAVKRRTIWMSDEEWTALTAFAEDHGQTVSAFIREQAVLTVVLHSAMRPLEPFATEPHTVEREAFLASPLATGKVERGGSFNSQPFTGPIPKKGK